MDSEQQFCLKWNNHQNTLVSVFDTLLGSGTLVDCTLAAGGQYVRAHKVVLSACSPFFELLLSQHCEKHPIVILKDVTFKELKAMIDYMYRGEVNVSQDQLGALLKAAESLQIKGLSDSGGSGMAKDMDGNSRTPKTTPNAPGTTAGEEGLARVDSVEDDLQQSRRGALSREGSSSPVPRKRKKHRRRSTGAEEGGESNALQDGHDQTSSCSERSQPVPNVTPSFPTSTATVPSSAVDEDKKPVKLEILPTQSQALVADGEQPLAAEELLEPKSEFLEEDINEESVEDLTLDDDDDDDDVSMHHVQPGPSHGVEGSNQGYTPWHIVDQSRDDIFMAAQEAVGTHRDTQAESCKNGMSGAADGTQAAVESRESAGIGNIAPDVMCTEPVVAPAAASTSRTTVFPRANIHPAPYPAPLDSSCATSNSFCISPLSPHSRLSPETKQLVFPIALDEEQILQVIDMEREFAAEEFMCRNRRPDAEASQRGSVENCSRKCVKQENLERSCVKRGSVELPSAPSTGVQMTGSMGAQTVRAAEQLGSRRSVHVTGVDATGSADCGTTEDVKPAVQDRVPLPSQPSASGVDARRVNAEPGTSSAVNGGSWGVAHDLRACAGENGVRSTHRASARGSSRTMYDGVEESSRRSVAETCGREPGTSGKLGTPRECVPYRSARGCWSGPVRTSTKAERRSQRSSSVEVCHEEVTSSRVARKDLSSQQSKRRKSGSSELSSNKRSHVEQWLYCPQCKKKFMYDFNLFTHVQFFCQPTRRSK